MLLRNNRLLKMLYYLFSIVIGAGCFESFMIIAFSWDNSFMSTKNRPLAVSLIIITLLIVILYLVLGRFFFKSKQIFWTSFVLIFLSFLLTGPTFMIIAAIYNGY
ncbi:hypothetical protein FHS14_004539 [Paenibacillus baekrokdamisoli]|nr:hypothetical protein [Paenibacillus baekrokdamisoli]